MILGEQMNNSVRGIYLKALSEKRIKQIRCSKLMRWAAQVVNGNVTPSHKIYKEPVSVDVELIEVKIRTDTECGPHNIC